MSKYINIYNTIYQHNIRHITGHWITKQLTSRTEKFIKAMFFRDCIPKNNDTMRCWQDREGPGVREENITHCHSVPTEQFIVLSFDIRTDQRETELNIGKGTFVYANYLIHYWPVRGRDSVLVRVALLHWTGIRAFCAIIKVMNYKRRTGVRSQMSSVGSGAACGNRVESQFGWRCQTSQSALTMAVILNTHGMNICEVLSMCLL